MILTTTILKDWLRPELPNIFDKKVEVGTGKIPDMPDRVILITKAGLGQELYNGLFEKNTYRFFCRGNSNSLDSAEQIAVKLNEFLDGFENYDMQFDDVDIRILLMKSRGVPRQLTITDSQSRFQFAVEVDITSSTD